MEFLPDIFAWQKYNAIHMVWRMPLVLVVYHWSAVAPSNLPSNGSPYINILHLIPFIHSRLFLFLFTTRPIHLHYHPAASGETYRVFWTYHAIAVAGKKTDENQNLLQSLCTSDFSPSPRDGAGAGAHPHIPTARRCDPENPNARVLWFWPAAWLEARCEGVVPKQYRWPLPFPKKWTRWEKNFDWWSSPSCQAEKLPKKRTKKTPVEI